MSAPPTEGTQSPRVGWVPGEAGEGRREPRTRAAPRTLALSASHATAMASTPGVNVGSADRGDAVPPRGVGPRRSWGGAARAANPSSTSNARTEREPCYGDGEHARGECRLRRQRGRSPPAWGGSPAKLGRGGASREPEQHLERSH